MAVERLNLVLPVGRYISGDHTKKRTTDFEGRPVPEDKQSFQWGVAVEKTAPGLNEVLQAIWNHVATYYARNQTVIQRMNLGFGVSGKQGGFSWKIKDGDVSYPDKNGVPTPIANAAGCYVFYFSTSLPFKCASAMASNAEIDPTMIKRGYYVDMAFSIAVNDEQSDRAGIYINPNIMRLVGYGQEIFGGITADQAFGSAPVSYVPAGMSTTPVAPAGGIPQVNPAAPAPVMPGFPGAPAAAGFPAQAPISAQPSMPGFPGGPGGAPQPQSAPSPTGFPINPTTGQPVIPHQQFLQPPR